MNTWLSLTKYLLSLNLSVIIFVNFAVFILILTSKLPSTIATSIIHSKLDCCNSLYYNVPQSQIKRLQNILKSLAVSPDRQNLVAWLLFLNLYAGSKLMNISNINSLLTTNRPQYLHDLVSVQPCHNTRSSSMVTVAHPPTRSSLKITNRSFQYAAPCLWNELATDLREPHQIQCPSLSPIKHGIFTIFTIGLDWERERERVYFPSTPNKILFWINEYSGRLPE